jgi:hypothetical protein
MKSPSGRGNDSRRRTTALPFLRCDGSIRLSDGRSNLIGCGCLHLFLLPSPLLLQTGERRKGRKPDRELQGSGGPTF